MTNCDRSEKYSDRPAEIRLPLLVMAAAADLQRPPETVAEAFKQFGSIDKTFVRAGKDDGFSVDFGHNDLLAGQASPAEIYPIVGKWLKRRSSPTPPLNDHTPE